MRSGGQVFSMYEESVEMMDGMPGPVGAGRPEPVIVVRNFMPETWMFKSHSFAGTTLPLPTTAPDTVTSWLASAYCMGKNFALRAILFCLNTIPVPCIPFRITSVMQLHITNIFF